jgi:hypothetical protein
VKRYRIKVLETVESVGYIYIEGENEDDALEIASSNDHTVEDPRIIDVDIQYIEIIEI